MLAYSDFTETEWFSKIYCLFATDTYKVNKIRVFTVTPRKSCHHFNSLEASSTLVPAGLTKIIVLTNFLHPL
jgi:hypothetical protein